MPGVEGQGTDIEQQRQDGLIATDVEGPATVEKTDTRKSALDWTAGKKLHRWGKWTPPQCQEQSDVKSGKQLLFLKGQHENTTIHYITLMN